MTDEVIAAVVDGLARRGVIADDLVTRDDVFSFMKMADGISPGTLSHQRAGYRECLAYVRDGGWPDNAARVLKGR